MRVFASTLALAFVALTQSVPAVAQAEFRLCGLFAYENVGNGVASFGTVHFDGAGVANIKLFINALAAEGRRVTTDAQAEGPYTFNETYRGRMVFSFSDLGIAQATYDFVAVDVEKSEPVELVAVLEDGGVNGQLVVPRLRLIEPCAPK